MNLGKVIEQGVAFIESQQQRDGSFLSFSTTRKNSFRNAKKYHSIFPTALILSCLNSLQKSSRALSLSKDVTISFSKPDSHVADASRDDKESFETTLKSIQKKAAKLLLSQKSEHWSFNYWARNSKQAKQMPYPDDLDDTFCALGAIYQYNSKLIDGSAMAKVVTLLTSVEEKEGGPYRTWLVQDLPNGQTGLPAERQENSNEAWKDIDLAVNSNVAYFLSLQDVHLPSIDSLVEQAIADNKFYSPYYPSEYPIIYFISRWYPPSPEATEGQASPSPKAFTGAKAVDRLEGQVKVRKLANHLLSKHDAFGRWGNPLNTALAVSSLLNFGVPPRKIKKSIDYLVHRQQKGIWREHPFVIELVQKRQGEFRRKRGYPGVKITYAGSAALTTAFCLEAVNKYNNKLKKQNSKSKTTAKNLKPKQHQKKIYEEVVKEARQRFLMLEDDLKKQALKKLNKTLNKDKDKQIVLMPYFFAQAIGKRGNELKRDFLVKLGLANLYGWIAYTIYDDFLDDEGEPKLLSAANVCLRELTTIYTEEIPNSKFQISNNFASFFHNIMDKLDAANTWEVSKCRIRNYESRIEKKKPKSIIHNSSFIIPNHGDLSQLAHKSLGHALGPTAILFSLGYSDKSAEVRNLMKFFKHYLIARQLNDDAHDWEEDLEVGHINAVGAEILKKLKTQNLKRQAIIQNSKLDSMQLFQKIFWHDVVVNVCNEVLKHVQKARDYLKRISVVSDVVMFEEILAEIEKSAKKALKERKETLEFLKAYSI